MKKQAEFLRRYDAGESTYAICTELKIPFYVAFMWIKKSGREVKENAINTLSTVQKVGYFGEQLFKKYAPKTCNINKTVKMNNPMWDFEYQFLKIDVKTARPTWNKNGVASWKFGKIANRFTDLVYVFFMLPDNRDERIELDDIDENDVGCLFIPSMLLHEDNTCFYFHEERGWDKYGDFMIELSELQANLDLIVQAA